MIASPLEFLGTFLNIHRLMYADWLLLLNLEPLVQAIVVLACLLSLRSAGDIFVYAAPSVATALICIPFAKYFAGHAPRTKRSAIVDCLGTIVLINLLAALLLLPFGFLSLAMIFSPLYYILGSVWSWIAGELRWRSFQPQGLTPVAK